MVYRTSSPPALEPYPDPFVGILSEIPPFDPGTWIVVDWCECWCCNAARRFHKEAEKLGIVLVGPREDRSAGGE